MTRLAGLRPASVEAAGARRPGASLLADALIVGAAGLTAFAALDAVQATLATAWAAATVVVVRSDLARFIIPDEASLAIAVLGLVARLAAADPDGWSAAADLGSAVAGGLGAAALFWGLCVVYRWRTGVDGLGFGDVKLAGACACWLTPAQQAATLEIACLAALGLVLVSARRSGLRGCAVPFGAFLAPAAWLVAVAGPLLAAGGWTLP